MKIKIISNARFRRAIFSENGKVKIVDFPFDATRIFIEAALKPSPVSEAVPENILSLPLEGRIKECILPDRKDLIAQAAALGVKTPEKLGTEALLKKLAKAKK